MRYMKAVLFAVIAIAVTCSFSTEATAQQKKKKKEKPRTEATLENTYWRLYEMDGKLVETPADAREVYIKLTEKKSLLEGYAGCNIITGNYELGKETLTFEPSLTERLCDDMTTENYVINALTKANRHELNGLHLLLYQGTYLLAIFEAKYYEE